MTNSFQIPPLEPSRDKKTLRRQLQAERQTLLDRHERAMHLQQVLRVFLATRQDRAIGAYWPIKGEFDALPALYRWTEAHERRRIGIPHEVHEVQQRAGLSSPVQVHRHHGQVNALEQPSNAGVALCSRWNA